MAADVRALLAAERQSRRISHPHLSYSKSGVLLCTICDLNVKSESLWPGHLKSANHRKNAAAQAAQEATNTNANVGKGVKRKIEDVEEVQEERSEPDTDARKKPKSQADRVTTQNSETDGEESLAEPHQVDGDHETDQPPAAAPPVSAVEEAAVDEDEWAAFEREVAPLATANPVYSSATITAAPVTAAQLDEQDTEDKRRRLETEADDEKEEEERRLEDEFEVMEEMEDRVRKLREKRDALRGAPRNDTDTGQGASLSGPEPPDRNVAQDDVKVHNGDEEEEDDDDDEDVDDWYS